MTELMKTGPRTHQTLGNQNKITLGHTKGMQTEGGVFKNLKTVLKPTKSQYDNSKNVSDTIPLPPWQTLPPASPLMSQALGKGRPSSLTDFQFSSVQSMQEINPGISLEGMMLKLKLQYFGHLMRRADSLEKTQTCIPAGPGPLSAQGHGRGPSLLTSGLNT